MPVAPTVESYLASLEAGVRSAMNGLRAAVRRAGPDLEEEIKWNAPSFADAGEDRVTLGVERKGGVRLVLHRGAKPRDVAGFEFADPAGLARWPAPDRGVVVFRNAAEVESQAPAVTDLVRRWLAATRA